MTQTRSTRPMLAGLTVREAAALGVALIALECTLAGKWRRRQEREQGATGPWLGLLESA